MDRHGSGGVTSVAVAHPIEYIDDVLMGSGIIIGDVQCRLSGDSESESDGDGNGDGGRVSEV